MNLYRGFSTKLFGFSNNQNTTNTTVSCTGVSLIKRDLFNHLFTRKTERVMQPSFGSTLTDLVFEQFDEFAIMSIQTEIERVISSDPRVKIVNLRVVPNIDQNLITVYVELFFVQLNTFDSLVFDIGTNSE